MVIRGFFDNVNHAKLLKQIWTLGIQDKNLLCLIGKMLKAPIEHKGERFIPSKGTPQGGVLSPLLANIVLNELDWWIASQWEEMPVHHASPNDAYPNKNGTLNKGNLYKKLRQSKLKECHIIRYADDFKIFCKTYGEAVRLKYAVEGWLMDRLKLETSKEKSKITNLKTGYSEFLGIKFKLIPKGGKWVIKSHMTEKAIMSQQKKLKKAIAEACRSHSLEISQHNAITAYNQMVVGMHEYYNMATMICADVHRMFLSIDITMKTRLNHRQSYTKEVPDKRKGGMDEYFYQKYQKSKQLRFINGMVVVPVAYCKTRNPMCHSPTVNRYTPEGRAEIHRMLLKDAYIDVLLQLGKDSSMTESIEFCDNRLARFVAVKGKCEISKQQLLFEDVACHRFIPKEQGGTDEYKNLRIVHKDVAQLIYETDVNTIHSLLEKTGCRESTKLTKLNKWRKNVGREPINLITLKQSLK